MKQMYYDITKKSIDLIQNNLKKEEFFFKAFLFQNNLKKEEVLIIDGENMSTDILKKAIHAFKGKKILLIEKSGFLDERVCYIKNVSKIK